MNRSSTADLPEITIAIPAHNEEAYLGPCLDAVITDVARDAMRQRLARARAGLDRDAPAP